MQTELKSYIRNKKKTPIGMVIAKKNSNGKVSVGWSLCRKTDKYDNETGYVKASHNQYMLDGHSFTPATYPVKNSSKVSLVFVPHTAYKTVCNMIQRSIKYFKVENEA